MLEKYCQDEFTVLKQGRLLLCREFMNIENIEVFFESITIASACSHFCVNVSYITKKLYSYRPGYTCKKKYGKKALMWLLHMEARRGEDNARWQRSRVQAARFAPLQCRSLLPRYPYRLRVIWEPFSLPYVPAVP